VLVLVLSASVKSLGTFDMLDFLKGLFVSILYGRKRVHFYAFLTSYSVVPKMVCIAKYESGYSCSATNHNTDGTEV
jgi:hypothetical protein